MQIWAIQALTPDQRYTQTFSTCQHTFSSLQIKNTGTTSDSPQSSKSAPPIAMHQQNTENAPVNPSICSQFSTLPNTALSKIPSPAPKPFQSAYACPLSYSEISKAINTHMKKSKCHNIFSLDFPESFSHLLITSLFQCYYCCLF